MNANIRSLVVDKTTGNRAKWIAESLYNFCEEIWYINSIADDRNGVYMYPNQDMRDRIDLPDYIDIILLHRTHLEALPSNVNYSRLINYTSVDGRCSGGGEYWINRGIKTKEDSLSDDEAKNLVQWALAPNEQELPALLQCSSRPISISLLVLCQGYLAVQDGENLNGWEHVPEELKGSAHPKKDEVIKGQWWKNGLGSLSKEEVVRRIKREMDINEMVYDSPISQLIRMIYRAESLDDSMVVANAYAEAKEVLRKV